MIEQVVLLVNQPQVPSIYQWRDLLGRSVPVEMAESWPTHTDAALVSVYRCDSYGCRAGTTPDTLGVMYIFDTWQYEPPNTIYPRWLISNAVWRTEPALETAVSQRLTILRDSLRVHTRAGETPIRSLTIDCAVLGMWDAHTQERQRAAIMVVVEQLSRLFEI